MSSSIAYPPTVPRAAETHHHFQRAVLVLDELNLRGIFIQHCFSTFLAQVSVLGRLHQSQDEVELLVSWYVLPLGNENTPWKCV